MGNKREGKASHAPWAKTAAAQRNASAYEERTGGGTIKRAPGRVVHEECDAATSRRPRHSGTERCKSGTKAAHKQAMRNWRAVMRQKELLRWRRSCRRKSSDLRLKLSTWRRKTKGYRRNWRRGQRGSVRRGRSDGRIDGAAYIVSIYIVSNVAFLSRIVYSSSSRSQVPWFFSGPCIRARARVPSPSPLSSSVGPEPEPSSLDSEMDDTLSLAQRPREPEHPSVSVGCRAFTGTYSGGIHVRI